MSDRPILSLRKSAPKPESNSDFNPEPKKKREKFTPEQQAEIEKKARKDRHKRRQRAFNTLLEMDLPYPIAKGSGKELLLKLRELGFALKDSKAAVQRWVTYSTYLEAVIAGKCRYHLDGTEAEDITELEKEYSRSILDSRKSANLNK